MELVRLGIQVHAQARHDMLVMDIMLFTFSLVARQR